MNIRIAQYLLVLVAAAIANCRSSGSPVSVASFSKVFPSIKQTAKCSYEARYVQGRDRLAYGKIEGSSKQILKFIATNGIEFTRDAEWAEIKLINIREVFETAGEIPAGWCTTSEIPLKSGTLGAVEVILCSSNSTWVLYLVRRI